MPAGVTKVAVAKAPGGWLVGGVLHRERPEIARYTGRADIAAAIAERRLQGVDEIGGCWIHPDWRSGGLATELVREVLAVAGARWTVTLANQFSLGAAVRAGFVPDIRFRDFPFPDKRFRSTLCWFDRGEGQ